MDKPYVTGWIESSAGKIPRVTTVLNAADRWGMVKSRLTIGRMNYKVEPGLYAVGDPSGDSPVLVTANYKFSFDVLRKNICGLDAWILVLDTRGINVWCAAGKGTFGTDELVKRLDITNLAKVVNHRRLILPQLGAPGVAAHEVKKRSGFSVVYGPVRAQDITAFLENGMQATAQMRAVRFTFMDRLVLVPAEFTEWLKYLLAVCVLVFIVSRLLHGVNSIHQANANGVRFIVNILMAYFAGTVLGPLLLPWLPGRSFSMKGFCSGLLVCAGLYWGGRLGGSVLEQTAWLLLICSVSSFITMNFTGASTYTSLSGVIKEMRFAVSLQLAGVLAGMGCFLVVVFW